LAELSAKNIIKRRIADIWGGYYYSLNTEVSKWNSNSINISKLCDRVGIHDFSAITQNVTVTQNDTITEKITVTQNNNSYPKTNVTVTQNDTVQLPKTTQCTLYKEILNKDIKKVIRQPLDAYLKELKTEFNDLDVDGEIVKCELWWSESKKQMKKPKTAYHNWMLRAREYKKTHSEDMPKSPLAKYHYYQAPPANEVKDE
jgi:hypothetical protein